MATSKIPVIPAGIAGIQMPRMASVSQRAFKNSRAPIFFAVIVTVHVLVNWIPAIPAGMTVIFSVSMLINGLPYIFSKRPQNP